MAIFVSSVNCEYDTIIQTEKTQQSTQNYTTSDEATSLGEGKLWIQTC